MTLPLDLAPLGCSVEQPMHWKSLADRVAGFDKEHYVGKCPDRLFRKNLECWKASPGKPSIDTTPR